MEEETAYSLLNVSKDASSKEILNSYRLLALKFHPKNYSAGDTFIHVHFRKLAEAYTTLIDPHKRREYDRSLGLNSSGNPRKPSFTNDPQLSKISRHEALLSRPRRNSYAGTELGSSNLLNSLDPRGLIPENVAKSHDFAGPDHDMARSDRVSKIPETNQSCFNSGFGRQLPSQTIQERPRRHSTVLNQPSLQLPSRSENFGNLISRPTSSYSNQIPSLIRPLPNRGPQSIQSQQTRPNIIRPGSCGPNLSQSSGTNSQNNSSGNMPFRAISISKTILIDADGSYHLEKVQKQRTFDESGTIRESYRRQKAGGQMVSLSF
ncbi:hypothetical protein BY996DRAFT_2734220 [Phakopsora pachyrhizi]|nr:hypothetical protein BY996DRAFT_2734220 [Phakopsora pachyrhizi]